MVVQTMKVLHVVRSPGVEGIIINVVGDMPTFPRNQDRCSWFKSQAEALYAALEETLPAGTFKQLSSIMRETP
jgi:hypothetical protein